MSLMFTSSFVIPSYHTNQLKLCDMKLQRNFSFNPKFFLHCNIPQKPPSFTEFVHPTSVKELRKTVRFVARECLNSKDDLLGEDSSVTYDWEDEEQEASEDMGSPWEGAVFYVRNPSVSHVEYCTTLERLGLGKLSTEVSRSRASVMGLRVTKAVKDFPLGTPVLISIDVTRKRKKLRLDGIVRSVITLPCNRCGEPTGECVFSNFSLLLTEDPIEEPETIDMGVIFGQDKSKAYGSIEEEEDDEASIDLDDWIYFPSEEKSVDISKHIRDMVHLEITINALCDPKCKGLCLRCGSNLNTNTCNCSKQKKAEKVCGPLGSLRKQMQSK
ncbi:hypothetical protein NMG60_11005276 [Bertholletia excelsa]